MNFQKVLQATKAYSNCISTYRICTKQFPLRYLPAHQMHYASTLRNGSIIKSQTRCFATDNNTITFTNDNSTFKRIVNKILGIEKSLIHAYGSFLYEAAADNLNYLNIIKQLSLPDTFHSWFVLIELHVWMLSVKCMAYEEKGRQVRNAVIGSMWRDVETRSKLLGNEANPSETRRQIKMLGQQFQAALISYDEGLLSEDDRILAGTVWRRIFQQDCDDITKIEPVVKYIRKQVKQLDETPPEKFFNKNPEINWSKFE